MRVALVSQHMEEAGALLAEQGGFFDVGEQDPEMVISYGGDGTLMLAEHRYPGVPKLYLKKSRIAKLAHQSKENEVILDHVVKGEYTVVEKMKLEVTGKGMTLIGLNDIVIHNENPRFGIRYTVTLDGEPLHGEIVGDGVVVATPLGSTAYYRSITDGLFEMGIGLAFNNSTEQSDHVVLREDRVIRVEIVRGPAVCYADNQEATIPLSVGESVEIRKSSHVARIITV